MSQPSISSRRLAKAICSCLAFTICSPAFPADETPAARIDFAADVAPILAQHCLACHSPNIRKGELSLATADDVLANEYVVPEHPELSRLIDVITSTDQSPPEMPQQGKPLTTSQVDLIRSWVQQGAVWPDDVVLREKSKADQSWWSLQPLQTEFAHASIDQFLNAKLAEKSLAMNEPADRRTLIRRATYDLIGLPPTPAEVDAFVNEESPDAFDDLIDRLLASPHYGERWGRHWLDVVRFGESIGFERNVIVNDLWPFRDYVIESINADKPFDRLIREHIAGDTLGDHPDAAVGTAFLVAGPYDDVGNQDAAAAAQIRANTLDEIIRATSTAFLGLTVGCARCHDHKFDAITQKDYYRLYATFAGIRHGSVPLATKAAMRERRLALKPLQERQATLNQQLRNLDAAIMKRAEAKLTDYKATWTRPAIDRKETVDSFAPVDAKFVRLQCRAQDSNPNTATGFRIDEFEVWSQPIDGESINVALQSNGGTATGDARQIEDFPGAYGPQLTIDGQAGARFIAAGTTLSIEFAKTTRVERVVFSSARGETNAAQGKFTFVAEYDIQVSEDGETWQEVANGNDRKPANDKATKRRLLLLETNRDDRQQRAALQKQLREVAAKIAQVPAVPNVWIGRRVAADAQGPFHTFVGGDPQKKGDAVVPASITALSHSVASYRLDAKADETTRRKALADWLVHRDNPLTPRILANRLWHYHFGTGIVDTPNDFGYMGGRPTHPELLDFLATKLISNKWRIKDMHRLIMRSDAYQQSSRFDDVAAQADKEARLLWRFPPRRLSAEEIRDTILHVAGQLDLRQGGPGFRLYKFMQDNVCTYVPLDQHGPETYRRAVYHQNARASVVDLMTEFDQPDCTFSAPRRSETTTPLQALTLLNHSFTLDMATDLAQRINTAAGDNIDRQIDQAYRFLYARKPAAQERAACHQLVLENGLVALCRVLLNTSELIYVR